MSRISSFFEFSPRQLRALTLLCVTAFLMGGYLLVRSYAVPTRQSPPFPVLLSDGDTRFTGLFLIDPNNAPADSLELLPGIGPVLADRIVAYRQHNRFEREVDITEVTGIGPKVYERLRPYLKIRR